MKYPLVYALEINHSNGEHIEKQIYFENVINIIFGLVNLVLYYSIQFVHHDHYNDH